MRQAHEAGTACGRPGPGRTDRDRRRRELSQNYLRGPDAARQFLRAVRLDPDGLCVEVGAGEGILTTRLAGMCREVVAYEVDLALADRLRERLRGRDNVRLVMTDFLAARPPSKPFQVVGNAPFSLTAPIVDWCLHATRMRTATLITQLEYARKRTGGYGRWTLLTCTTWPQVSWELRGKLPRTLFSPVPRVDAGICTWSGARPRWSARPGSAPTGSSCRRVQRRRRLGAGVAAPLLPAGPSRAGVRDRGPGQAAVVAFVSPDQWVQIFTLLDARGKADSAPRCAGRRASRCPARASAPAGPLGRPRSGRAGQVAPVRARSSRCGRTCLRAGRRPRASPDRLWTIGEGHVGDRGDPVHRSGRQVDRVAGAEVLARQVIGGRAVLEMAAPVRTLIVSSFCRWYCRLSECPAVTWRILPMYLPSTAAKMISWPQGLSCLAPGRR